MTVISSHKDPEALTLTIVAEFETDPGRVWQLWEDPRQLERWWGPPTWPATFSRHDFTEGGTSQYYMTGPEGDTAGGWWRTTVIEPPRRLVFDDGFAHDDGTPNGDLPLSHVVVTFDGIDGGTRMMSVTTFDSLEQLEQLMAMGMEEGLRLAMGQMDELLLATV
jgi:uncharacterized protein YndB with AHSA1/START domain